MSDFKVIETQEQLDAIIKDRIARAEAKAVEKYADYEEIKAQSADKDKQIAALSTKLEEQTTKKGEYDKQIAELTAQVKEYAASAVKTRIAHEVGLPYELAKKLEGDNEEAIRADAESLAKLIKPPAAPIGSNEPVAQAANPTDAAFMTMLNNLKE